MAGILCKAEQPLQGTELQEEKKSTKEIIQGSIQEIFLERTYC